MIVHVIGINDIGTNDIGTNVLQVTGMDGQAETFEFWLMNES